jgi:hypothetical protein
MAKHMIQIARVNTLSLAAFKAKAVMMQKHLPQRQRPKQHLHQYRQQVHSLAMTKTMMHR